MCWSLLAVSPRLLRNVLHAIVLEPADIGLTARNVSGMTTFARDHAIRQLKLLEILIPGLRAVACLSDRDAPRGADGINPLASAMMLAARHPRLRMQCVELQGADADLPAAFDKIRRSGAQALVVLGVPAALARLGEIARLAESQRLPAVFPPGGTDTGVVTLGTALHDAVDPLAECVVALSRGAMVADLPLRRVRTERLVVHVGNARRIGLVIPDAVLRKATEVIGDEAVGPSLTLNVDARRPQRIGLNELPARLDLIPHQHREHAVGLDCIATFFNPCETDCGLARGPAGGCTGRHKERISPWQKSRVSEGVRNDQRRSRTVSCISRNSKTSARSRRLATRCVLGGPSLTRSPTRHLHFFPDSRGTGPAGFVLSAFDNAVAAAESRSTADLYAALSSRRSTDSTITMSLSSSTS